MEISKELKEKIERNFKNNEELKDKLLSCNVEAIRKIGLISQKGINPKDVVKSYENNTLDYLYEHAKKLIELDEIYSGLCDAVARDYNKER